ncbi:nuclease SbcCD [Streptomyces viridosporus ATCC 14672]|uniref:Nuclease SbcCD subunit D n=1 Tax=Streptomyces viridosporus (strain ATCC 14672 / DSM 40746 / JCM 4963 / KCTC 9882 / NRRL B-12104 / FH 1290) TaxID=566461 RepID=D6A5K9_STRV1|nr:exonuclease SbcCD subunit D [Streptomyces viridosporus]EFE71721.1 nuclease SbcCD [Streptomyces viridosporus ATCC 14672]
MKFLHTSDWHVGKVLKGHNRLDEQRTVLREIVRVARDHRVDAVLVAGDLYESSAPSAQAQQLLVQTLLALRRTGAEVIAIAGNHDHAATFDAYRPLMASAGITLAGTARPAADGGVVEFTARSTGEPVAVALLPFLARRHAVRAAQLVTETPREAATGYGRLVRDLLAALTAGFRDDTVNLVMAHLTAAGGKLGGGERSAQSVLEYWVPTSAFPPDAHYVALGHLHRRQSLPAPCPVHYCGSPITLDFGEENDSTVVLVVEAEVGTPTRVTAEVPIGSGRRLRTVRGTVDEVTRRAEEFGDDYLRVLLCEPARAGLRQDVQRLLPNALEVRIDPGFAAPVHTTGPSPPADGADRSPAELFHAYCIARGIADERVEALFTRLHDQATATHA